MSEYSFAQLGIAEKLLNSLNDLGFKTPTPVQVASIPAMLDGRDIRAQAQTGTGKTAAFGLPILQRLGPSRGAPQAIVITPTRELAQQVAEAMQSMAGGNIKAKITTIYGGADYRTQLRALKDGVDVVVGTPGRILDHIERGSLQMDAIKAVVLDEADEMLNMGFIDDIKMILEVIPGEHQTALFSATMPKDIKNIAKDYLRSPEIVQIENQVDEESHIEEFQLRIDKHHKIDTLLRLMLVEPIEAAIVFVATKQFANELAEQLQSNGHRAQAIHGDMKQNLREQVVGRLRKGKIDVLIATDVAARGLDVPHITHVFNFDIPYDAETYTHRIGRTGRAGRAGRAFLLTTPSESRLVDGIERRLKRSITLIEPPNAKMILECRDAKLLTQVAEKLEDKAGLDEHSKTIERILEHCRCETHDLASVLVSLLTDKIPLNLHPINTASLKTSKPKPRRRNQSNSSANKKHRTRPHTGSRAFDAKRKKPGFKKKARAG